MRISLSELMNLPAKTVLEKKVSYEADQFVRMDIAYPVIEKDDISLVLTNLSNKKVKVEIEGRVVLKAQCDRCLEDVPVTISFSDEDEIDFNETEEDRIKNLNEVNYLNGYDLDVDKLVCEEILLGFPMKVLCQNECKGICKVCGANLNLGDCGCDRTEPDPRMSVIRDIFNNFKEV